MSKAEGRITKAEGRMAKAKGQRPNGKGRMKTLFHPRNPVFPTTFPKCVGLGGRRPNVEARRPNDIGRRPSIKGRRANEDVPPPEKPRVSNNIPLVCRVGRPKAE